MRSSRRTAVALAGALTLVWTLAGPAAAAPAHCQVLLGGPTPGPISVDLEGDGEPEASVPSVGNVTLCAGADVVLEKTPAIEREQCGGFGSCMMFFVDYGVRGYAEASLSLCYTVDGHPFCSATDIPRLIFEPTEGTACIGYDLRGGFPCGAPITFD